MEGMNGGAAARAVKVSERIMQFHPVAELFDLMKGDAFDALCDDVRENGLRDEIFVAVDPTDGIEKIADGRNRYSACMATGVEPRFRRWNGDGNLVSIVVSLNLHRRHLSESQRAMVAAKLANLRRGRPETNPSIGGNMSQTAAATLLSVSPKSVERASKVLKQAEPEVAEMVSDGEMSVTEAAKFAELPKGRQKRIIRKGRNEVRRTLSRISERAVKNAVRGRAVCLVCSPDTDDTESNFLAAVQLLAGKFPRHARYLNDVAHELAESTLIDGLQEHRTRIIAAVDAGHAEATDCRRVANLTQSEFDQAIAVMVDYGTIAIYSQGGKTETARGARKKIIRILRRPVDLDDIDAFHAADEDEDEAPIGDLIYELDDEYREDLLEL